MSVYLIANLKINDRERYTEYEAGFFDIFSEYNGNILAVDEAQDVLEGDYDFTRTVLIEFPTKADARAWYDSDAYQELAAHRWASSDGVAVMIEGLPPS